MGILANLDNLRDVVRFTLALGDLEAVYLLLAAKSKTPSEISKLLHEYCKPGGKAERLADEMEDRKAAKECKRRMIDRFSAFSNILTGILPRRDTRYISRAKKNAACLESESPKQKEP